MGSRIPKLEPEVLAKRSVGGLQLFRDSASTVLSRWDLLRTAVIEEWGGRSSSAKYEHMLSDLFANVEDQWREGNDLHVDTLDVYFLECLEGDFNIDFEDDTGITALSTVLQDLYRKCAAGNREGVAVLLASLDGRPDFNSDSSRPARGPESDEEEESGEEGEGEGEGAGAGAGGGEHVSRRAHVVDEEGWETMPTKPVARKGKGAPPGGPAEGGPGPKGLDEDMGGGGVA